MCDFEASFQSEIQPLTGVWDAQFSAVRTKFESLTLNARSKMIYIGISSSGKDGCKSRWNAKYKALGLNRMAQLYLTYEDNAEGRVKIENEMGEYFGDVATIVKGMSGNGMHPFIVYVAWHEESK